MMRLACTALVVLGACTNDPQPAAPVPSPELASPVEPPHRSIELRIGVGAMLSPMATFESYDALLRGLARALGRPYQLVQRRTYEELNQLIVDGEVDLAFLCSGAYVALPEDAVEILVVPVYGGGKAAYHGLIVTRRDASYRRFADLEQTRFAFTDPLSNTGHLYPATLIVALGKKPSTFFASTIFSGSHDRSLLAVERGIVDAAAVFDVGYDTMNLEKRKLRVLDTSAPMASPPVVAPRSVPVELRDAMRRYLLEVVRQPRGQAQLEELGVERFQLPGSVDYGPIRRMAESIAGDVSTQ